MEAARACNPATAAAPGVAEVGVTPAVPAVAALDAGLLGSKAGSILGIAALITSMLLSLLPDRV